MASAGGDARLNLEAWSRDLLGDAQLENVAHLAAWCQQSDARTARTSHEEEKEEEGESNIASTSRLPPDDRDNTAAVLGPTSSAIKLPSEPITSSSALLPWLESIKPLPSPATGRAPSSTTTSTPAQLSHINSAAKCTTSLLSQLESARINVAELKAGSRSVEETAEELRNESESSSGRTSSHHLSHLVSTLDSHLSYYSILPQATQFLSSPSLNQVVLSERFGLTMAQCDAAYEFVRARPHWRDAAIHRLRFEHCITRGGTLARMWVVGRFKELGAQVITGLKERGKALPAGGQDGTLMEFADAGLLGILYPSYVNAAQEVRSVLAEITKRCTRPRPRGGEHGSNQDTTDADGGDADGASSRGEPLDESSMLHDYQGAHLGSEADEEEDEIHTPTFTEFDTLLSDCRAAYFDSRRNALLPLIGAALAKIEGKAAKAAGGAESETQSQSPLVLFLSQSLKMLTPLLGSEYRLDNLFFDIGTTSHAPAQEAPQGLLDFLSSLSKELSDRLHPRIYAESRLSELARLAETVLEAGHDDEHEGKMPSLFSVSDPHDFTALLPRWEPCPDHQGATAERTWLHGPLVKPVYLDIAARLTFRARAILQGRDVAGYTPADEGEMLHAIRAIKARAADAEVDVDADVQSKGRRKRKARESLGVGVLQAAAQRALEEHTNDQQQVGAVPSSSKHAQQPQSQSQRIVLFSLPPSSTLNTWPAPLSRALRILHTLHPVLSRSTLAELGVEAVQCVRGVLRRQQSAQPGEGRDSLDLSLYRLRSSLLLRELSASVDLSLAQPCRADELLMTGLGAASGGTGPPTLDVGAVSKVVGGLLDAVRRGWASSAGGREQPHQPAGVVGVGGALAQDVAACTRSVLDEIVAQLEAAGQKGVAAEGNGAAELDRRLNSVSSCVSCFVEDEEVARSIMRGAVREFQGRMDGSSDEEKEILRAIAERLGLGLGTAVEEQRGEEGAQM